MAQFLVLAYDGTDPNALERRQAARGLHLESVRPMVENGEVVAAGPILTDDGKPIGSVLFVEFPGRAELDAWLEHEPYVRQGVWQRIEVMPMRIVAREGTLTP